MKYRIKSIQSDQVLGTYEGDTPQEALDVLARDAGYRDAAHAAEAGDDGAHLRIMLEQCAVGFELLTPQP